MECIRLDEHALEIQFAEQLPQHRPCVVLLVAWQAWL